MTKSNKLRLTNKSIDQILALAPTDRARRYWDTEAKGFYMQFSRAGTASFMLRYTKLDGSDGDFSIGLVDEIPVTMAREVANEKVALLRAKGIDPMVAKRQMREEARTPKLETFGQIAEAFLAKMESQRSGKRQIDEVRFLKTYVLPVLGNRKVDRITTQDVEDLIQGIKNDIANRKRRKGATGRTTANICHRAIKRVLRWAMKSKLCSENVADFRVLYPITLVKRIDRLNEERFALFWNAAVTQIRRGWGGRRSGLLAQLLYMATLQRPIDIARAKREHFDLSARTWNIPGDFTKTGAPYYIPLTDLTLMLVKHAMALQAGGFLFPSDRPAGYMDESTMSQNWRRQRDALKESGDLSEIDIELYDCRRFGRTQIRHKLAFEQEVAEAVINHAPSAGMETRYDVFDVAPRVRCAQEAWSQEILAMTGMKLDDLDRE